jgi:hypothetical protein
MRTAAALLVAVIASGCGLLPSAPPDWVVNRNPLPSCGEETLEQGELEDVGARTCLLQAFQEGRAAELISQSVTIEGDPITRYVRVHENGVVEVFVDATRDRFGSGEWERLRCEALVPVEQVNDPPDLVLPARMVFVEDGCAHEPVP